MPIEAKSPFHRRLKEALVYAGLPAEPSPIAKRIKVSNRQTVHRVLQGGHPKPDLMARLADGLKVDFQWLSAGKGSMVPNTDPRLTAEELDLLNQVFRPLKAERPDALDEWIRQGRKLVEFLTPAGPHNPNSFRRK